MLVIRALQVRCSAAELLLDHGEGEGLCHESRVSAQLTDMGTWYQQFTVGNLVTLIEMPLTIAYLVELKLLNANCHCQ